MSHGNTETSNINSDAHSILIIEDEPAYAELIQTALERAGYKVNCENTGAAGLSSIVKSRPKVIILDVMLPIQDGFSFLAELKKQKNTMDIPVVILSNMDEPLEVARGMKLGAAAYLVKFRVKIKDLIDKINECANY